MLEAGRELERSAVEHLVGRIIYGGRIRRSQDELVILSLLRELLKVALQEPAGDEEADEAQHTPTPAGGEDSGEDEEEEKGRIASLFPDYIGELGDLLDFAKVGASKELLRAKRTNMAPLGLEPTMQDL